MILGKRLINTGVEAACTTDTADVFGDSSGVALYTLDYDGSDASGNYDGTPTDVEFGVGGQINYGARFNGSSSKITLPSGFLDSAQTLSFSVWVNPTNILSFSGILDKYIGSTSGWALHIPSSTNKFAEVLVYNGSDINTTATTALPLGDWTHIVGTISTSQVKIYINGTLEDTSALSSPLTTNTTPLIVGGDAVSTLSFDGSIDQLRFFTKELNSTEVSTLYAETACVYTCTTDTVDYPTTNVAYYKLDNDATDETGSYDGTETDISYTFGRFGQAAVFNGSSSYIDTGISGATLGELFSVSVWFKTSTTSTFQTIFDNGGNTSGSTGFAIIIGTDNILKALFTNSGGGGAVDIFSLSTGVTVTDGDWHHCVLTYNDESAKIYLDNSTPSTGTNTEPFTQAANALRIGAYYASGTSLNFNGDLDQIRVFTSELDSTQVTQLYEEKPCADTSTFETVLYSGNNSTQYISSVGFEPDLVWIKGRNVASNHALFDSVRGAGKRLETDSTVAENTSYTYFDSFDANGFSLDGSQAAVNGSYNYVAWCLKAGGDAVSNTNGDITSQVSANAAAGFSIVKYSGSTSPSNLLDSVGHGLGAAPEMVIYKATSGGGAPYFWEVWHKDLTNENYYLILNDTAAETLWTDIPNRGDRTGQFTSTTFPITYTSANGVSGIDYIAYCFHSVSGVSKVGSYTGAGYPSTVTELTGFSPRWVMIKRTDATSSVGWWIWDSARDNVGLNEKYLVANSNASEGTAASGITFLSNGFEIDTTATDLNASGGTYIYLAFA